MIDFNSDSQVGSAGLLPVAVAQSGGSASKEDYVAEAPAPAVSVLHGDLTANLAIVNNITAAGATPAYLARDVNVYWT